MTDIVDRLRKVGKDYDFHENALIFGAADEIERLRTEIGEAIEIIDRLELAESSVAWHRRRWLALQMHRTKMREPERTIVCDILANGELTHPTVAGDRYAVISEVKTQPAQSVKDAIIDDLQSQFDTEGIKEHDSGDALIRLSDAIAAVEDNFAQLAPSIPEGWGLVPIEPTEKMANEGSCASTLPGPRYISEECAKQCWEYMIKAAPEAKP